MDHETMKLVAKGQKENELFDKEYPFYCLVEVASNDDPELVPESSERLLEFIGVVEDNIKDGIVPQGEGQANKIWNMREDVAVVASEYGFTLSYDISLDSKSFYKIVEYTRQKIAETPEFTASEKESIKTIGYGHIGDGNLHINISIPGYDNLELAEKLDKFVQPIVMGFVREHKGSVSAEHGIGSHKTSFLEYSKSKPMIDYMKKIKQVFDPNGIMNPYKVLP